jgi:hypothetical protein
MELTMLELYRRARGWSQAAKPSSRQQRRLREVFGDLAEAILRPVDPAHVGAPQGDRS